MDHICDHTMIILVYQERTFVGRQTISCEYPGNDSGRLKYVPRTASAIGANTKEIDKIINLLT